MAFCPTLVVQPDSLCSPFSWLLHKLYCSISMFLRAFYPYGDCSVNSRVVNTWEQQFIAIMVVVGIKGILGAHYKWVEKVPTLLFEVLIHLVSPCGSLCLRNWNLLVQCAGPAITIQVIQSIEVELTEVVVQLLGNCSAEEFYAIMRLLLQGLEMRNTWQQKAKVRNELSLLSSSFFSFL